MESLNMNFNSVSPVINKYSQLASQKGLEPHPQIVLQAIGQAFIDSGVVCLQNINIPTTKNKQDSSSNGVRFDSIIGHLIGKTPNSVVKKTLNDLLEQTPLQWNGKSPSTNVSDSTKNIYQAVSKHIDPEQSFHDFDSFVNHIQQIINNEKLDVSLSTTNFRSVWKWFEPLDPDYSKGTENIKKAYLENVRNNKTSSNTSNKKSGGQRGVDNLLAKFGQALHQVEKIEYVSELLRNLGHDVPKSNRQSIKDAIKKIENPNNPEEPLYKKVIEHHRSSQLSDITDDELVIQYFKDNYLKILQDLQILSRDDSNDEERTEEDNEPEERTEEENDEEELDVDDI